MELRQLRYFIALAEELHFGRAAERVHIAQPPLSLAIRSLEEEVGARLFERSSRAVRLTPAGAALLTEVRQTLSRLNAAADAARRIHLGEAGGVAVGFMNPVMDAVLCRALAEFRRRRPGVSLRLRELPTPMQLEELRAGRLDIAFIRTTGAGAQDLRGLAKLPVCRENYVLALPRGHVLAKLRRVPLALAGEHPLILFPRAGMPHLYDAMLQAFRDSGVEPLIAQEMQGKHASLALVAAGLGLCLVPASARDWKRRDVVLRPVDGPLPTVEMSAAWRPECVPASALALAELAASGGVV